ncbi:unnamed protein product [Ascophyllum nodosum]
MGYLPLGSNQRWEVTEGRETPLLVPKKALKLSVLGALLSGVAVSSWHFYTAARDPIGPPQITTPGSGRCFGATLSKIRSPWSKAGKLCRRKLPFEFWIYMKSEGAPQDSDATYIWKECLKPRNIGLVELTIPEEWDTTLMDKAPGQRLHKKTRRAASYVVRSPLDFEVMCEDDQVTKVSRVNPSSETHAVPRGKSGRRLPNSLSEAGTVHRVAALIRGLEKLGCQRTTGENQTLCIMSDSFNFLGNQPSLQESGDLPPDEGLKIVQELPFEVVTELGIEPSDEGSAMTELAYDIAKGANFKFNTMFMGSLMAADDIIKLSSGEEEGGEACDIIIDDITYLTDPLFRDGILSQAVDEAVKKAGALYFASAGNYGNGYKFKSNWEPDVDGTASHVFDTEATGFARYFLPLNETPLNSSPFYLHWDGDEGTSRTVILQLFIYRENSEGALTILDSAIAVSDPGTAVVSLTPPENLEDDDLYALTISQEYWGLEDVEMRLISKDYHFFSNFSDGSISGHKCASSVISVAAFDIKDLGTERSIAHQNTSGTDGGFANPETGSVTSYSSRGPCYVDSGGGLETRRQPVITAATGLQTSTNPELFAVFEGTSASAPVAGAIASIIRAACYPRPVTYDDMMEIMTNYNYTIDVTSDAGGEVKTWGAEAGYGIMSAAPMLDWVAANCQESCSAPI